jgi:hypothetical protein
LESFLALHFDLALLFSGKFISMIT